MILTRATGKKGTEKLFESIRLHRKYLNKTGEFESFFKSRFITELKQILLDHTTKLLEKKLKDDPGFKRLLNNKNSTDPYTAAEKIINRLF